EFTWRREILDQERVRSQVFRWAWPDWASEGQQSCGWFAYQRFAENPRTVAVRCRLFRRQSPSPAEVRNGTEPEGHYEEMRTFHRPLAPRKK
ncbi:MAG TPA: hypothetical protein VMV18_00260, partial [bacterium]|nr:hypothetical protein [bacterium]